MDPLSIITLISAGLKGIDQFRELALKFFGKNPTPPSSKAEQSGTALEISHNNVTYQKVESTDLKMDQWDEVRYEALNKRIRSNWYIYNDLFVSEAGASAQEGARIRNDVRNVQETLCKDFKEMVKLYERTLGVSLPDHYQLYEVCK